MHMNSNLKILILLFYYDRPELVKNALHSIAHIDYNNFEVAFINDSADIKGKDLVNYLQDHPTFQKYKYYDVGQTLEDKLQQGGSIFGKYANQAIQESNADIVVMLCDDDAVLPNYLADLNTFYSTYPEINWGYSKVKYYNPAIETYLQAEDDLHRVQQYGSVVDLNKHITPINPDCACDASQVSFRRKCFVEKEAWFPYPQTRNLDSAIYNKMYQAWGPCYPTFVYGQCKGVFPDQLGCRTQGDFQVSIN